MDYKLLFTYAWIASGVITFFYLLFVKTAPYGRHSSSNWGPMISNKLGWVLMESPAFFLFIVFVFYDNPTFTSTAWVFITLFLIHYFNRTFIFPLRTRTKGKKMPLVIALSGVAFNGVNTWLIGSYLNENSQTYTDEWLSSPQFIIGLSLFIIGFIMNNWADHILLNLRKPGETGYKIPKGFLFKRLSSPNLIGEMIEWTGYFIMVWSVPALTFAVWTIANLAPRVVAHHKWYKVKFENYPKERKPFGLF